MKGWYFHINRVNYFSGRVLRLGSSLIAVFLIILSFFCVSSAIPYFSPSNELGNFMGFFCCYFFVIAVCLIAFILFYFFRWPCSLFFCSHYDKLVNWFLQDDLSIILYLALFPLFLRYKLSFVFSCYWVA